MAAIPISNITDLLAQSIGLEAAENVVIEVLSSLSIPRKSNYDREDYDKIIEALKEKGGIIASIVEIATADRYLQVVERKKRGETFRDAYNIVRKSPVVLVSWKNDDNLSIEFITDNVEHLLGYKADEIVNTRSSYYDYVDDETKSKLNTTFDTLRKGKEKIVNLEHAITTQNGETKWVDCRVFTNVNDEDAITQFQGILLDITERVASEKKVKELNELRETSLKVLSHQMRTPLTVTNFSLMTVLPMVTDEGQKKLVTTASNASSTAIRILGDILVAIEVIEGKFIFKKETADLNSIVTNVVEMMKPKFDEKKVTLTYLDPASQGIQLDKAEVDVKKVTFIVEKLIENALIFTPKGSVEIGLNKVENWYSFWIKDTGIGIPAAEQEKIFKSFYRATNAFKVFENASGISLYISKAYVEGMGGTIGFESEEDKGSTFWFRLPYNFCP